MKPILLILVSSLSLFGCSTLRTNMLIGAGMGAGIGGVSGAAIGSPDHPIRGSALGAASGAALGALIGYLSESKKGSPPDAVTAAKGDGDFPPMLSPKVHRIWIPDHISDDGRKFEKGHYSYEIERGTLWTMP